MLEPHVFFSNRVEVLFDELKHTLYSNSTPFTRRLVVVPSPAMKSWLMLRMANDPDLGIAAGLDISYLDQSIAYLKKWTNPTENPAPLTSLEIALQIESFIREILKKEQLNDLWNPLKHYLRGNAQKQERRIVALSEKLAPLFIQYRTYGREMIENWKNEDDWQSEIYKNVLGDRPWQDPKDLRALETQDIHIHLFAMSFVPKHHHDFLMQVSPAIPIRYYLLSPCEVFWSDIVSDRERRRLQTFWERKGASEQQKIELDSYLVETNPLLANFGRLGREMAHQVEESITQCEGDYFEPDRSTALGNLLGDILLLEKPEELVDLPEEDRSIQVHVASSQMREIEILYQNILQLIEESPGLTPSDVVVMAPNIIDYEPFVKAVFGHEDSILDFQMMDLDPLSENSVAQGFIQLLKLPTSRWDVTTLLQFLESRPVRERFGFDVEQLARIRKWTIESGVRWGKDRNHRNRVLHEAHCNYDSVEESEMGTWEEGFHRLLMALVSDEYDLDVEITQAELLGQWIKLLRNLEEKLQPLLEGQWMNLEEWMNYLKMLCDEFLLGSEADMSTVIRQVEALGRVEKVEGIKYPFQSIRRHLEAALSRQRVSYRESHLHAVRFCSLLPMRAIPSQVIVMIGMHEGAYPRRDPKASLNRMIGNRDVAYCPSQTDFDRYLFLEAMLSVRKYFIMSYVGLNSSDGKEQLSSLLVSELLGYLDRGYRIGGKFPSEACVVHHPFHRFDSSYFSNEGRIKSYMKSQYNEAVAFYGSERKESQFINGFTIQKYQEVKPAFVSVRELSAVAYNPVQAYFNQSLGMYLKKAEDRIEENDDAFMMSAMESAMLRREGVEYSTDRVLKRVEQTGNMPIGMFKGLATSKIEEEVNLIHQNMKSLGVHPNDFITIEISEKQREIQKTETGWIVPSLKIGNCEIFGKLEKCSPQGLLAILKDDKKDVVKTWPQYLLFVALNQKYNLGLENGLLFLKDGKRKNPFFESPEKALEDYLEYYFCCRMNVSPLIPEWVFDIISKDSEEIEEKIEKTLSDKNQYFFNDYLKWIWTAPGKVSGKEIVENWKPIAVKVYGEMFLEWYGKKKKSVTSKK